MSDELKDELKDIYKRVFDTDDGHKVIEDLSRRFYVETSTFMDGDETIFNEGQRATVLFIKNMIKDPILLDLKNVIAINEGEE